MRTAKERAIDGRTESTSIKADTYEELTQAETSVVQPDGLHELHQMPERFRLHAAFIEDRFYMEQLNQHAKRTRDRRIDAVLNLKKNLDASCLKFQENALRRKKKAKQLEEQHLKESHELLSQGKNPHEVFRQRQVEQDSDKQRHQLEASITSKQLDILKRLEVEKGHLLRQEEVRERDRDFERKYQQEMGRSAEERRVQDYMVLRTGKQLVDPTSKQFRFFPSQETSIPDRSFGLGKNLVRSAYHRAAVVEKIHEKYHHKVEPRRILLPRVDGSSYLESSSTRGIAKVEDVDGVEVRTLLVPGSDMKGLNQINATSSLLPPILGHAPVPERVVSSAHRKKGFGKPRRSVLEMKLRHKALAKQNEQVYEPQVVWGKEFVGQAFLCDPPVLWFKDFDIGATQTIPFQLTNVSNTFNQFKVLDLPEQYCDVFELHYEKPGRMSAGTSCKLYLSFCATQNIDIDMEIPAVCKTGPFSIKVKCTCKKAIPVLEVERVEFTDIVIGETYTKTLILENKGALELPYEIAITPVLQDRSPVNDNAESTQVLSGKSASTDIMPKGPVVVEDAAICHDEELGNLAETDERPVVLSEHRLVELAHLSEPNLSESHIEERCFVEYAKSFGRHTTQQSSDYKWLHFCGEGSVHPYSSTTIPLTFAPMVPSVHTAMLTVNFRHPLSTCQKALVPVMASTLRLPIYLEETLLDFECCCYDTLYRHRLIVRNRGKYSLRIEIRLPHALESVLEFIPSMGYVQGASSTCLDSANETHFDCSGELEVLVKFRPKSSMWGYLEKKKFGSKKLLMFALPVQIIVPDQVLPVYTVLTARLTSVDLTFEPSTIDFGECIIGQSLSRQITIRNVSRVPQRFGFIKLPREIGVDPNDGFGTLLPDETCPISITYSPLAATDLKCKIICRSSNNQQYELVCLGIGVVSPLILSHSIIQMAAVSIGQSSVCSISCENTTDESAMFELVQPAESAEYLRISPSVGVLPGRKKARVEIAFVASSKLFQLKSTVFDGSDVLSINATMSEPLSDGAPGLNEPKSCHHCFRVLCFVNAGRREWPLIALDVNTNVTLPRVAAQPDYLDFGQVAIGQVLHKDVELMNCTNESAIELSMQPLHAFGAFRLVNCLRGLPPKTVKKHRIEFQPTAQMTYEEELMVMFSLVGNKSPQESTVISLRGEGINPQLEVQPSDGLLDFRDVLARNRMTMDVVLRNLSTFPLPFRIKNLNRSEMSLGNIPVFTCFPCEAVIQPNAAITVRVTFSPERERPSHYQHRWKIEVPNESEEHILIAKGRCWENQLYLFAEHSDITSDVDDLSVEDVFDGFGSALALPVIPLLPVMCDFLVRKPSKVVALVFAENEFRKQLFIGSTLSPLPEGAQAAVSLTSSSVSAPSGAPPSSHGIGGFPMKVGGGVPPSPSPPVVAGSFEFSIDAEDEKYQEFFSIDLTKGNINVGQQQTIHIDFQPRKKTADNTDSVAFHEAHQNLLVPQRVQLRVQCTLRGGFLWKSSIFSAKRPGEANDSQPAVQSIRLVLQAQIHTTM